ncbi:peptidyl-prolyl cis-trans isomerase precursor [Dionaea muscipula]
MEEAAAPSEASTRRSKRVRNPQFNVVDDDELARGSEPSDQSPARPDREDSFGDFEEVRPKAKGGRAVGETSGKGITEQSLIEIIKGNRKAITQAVKYWVEHYEKDPKGAIADLLATFFEACGVKYNMRGDLLDEADVDDIVLKLVNCAKNGQVEDYQSSKRKDFNNFKDNLVYFWDNLVSECQNGQLFDEVLFEKCMDYVIAISCTPPRLYRQVASLVGLQLVTSFIMVAKVLGGQRETTQRQLNAEIKRRVDGPRVESLGKRLSSTHEKITKIEAMMRKIFLGLFVHRYRDIDPNIRMSCIQSLGVWILSYPSLFLQDLYLKYLGWTLNDKNAAVRKACVIALQNLYELDDNVPSLALFTERFSTRMIELADDVDISVAVSAVGLVKQLLKHKLLIDDDLGPLYDLLVDEPPEIRRAIGELVYDHLIAQKYSTTPAGSKGNDNDSLVTLGRMLQILREFSTDPILSAYVIDDVWEFMVAMKDWKCIISMLMDENPSIELSENDATNLIRLLCASIKKAVGEKIVPSTDSRKRSYTKAQKEVIENSRRSITVAMMKNYPQLLQKYIADKAKVPPLVEIIMHMNLELYCLKRQEQSFSTVLQLMKEAFFKHGDKEALRSCLKSMNFCCLESKGEVQDFALNKFKEIEDEVITKLKTALREVAEGEDEYLLLVNLKRLYEIQLLKFVPVDSLFEEFVATLAGFQNSNDEVVSFLLLNMYLHIAWCLHAIVCGESVSEASLSSLLSKRTILFNQLGLFLPDSSRGEGFMKVGIQLASRVCTICAEAWCLFRKSNFSATKLEILGFCPDESTLKQFWELCEHQLSISDNNEEEGEYVEETNRDVAMIAAAKLVASDTVPKVYLCPEIISHFVMHGSNVAEIIKQLIMVIRQKEEDVSVLFLEALKRAYQRHMVLRLNENEEPAKKSFLDCKALAIRLSGTYMGAARNKHRTDILKIVKDGIEYAFLDMPKQLSFLEGVVLHFVSKLPTNDVLDILTHVQGRTANINTDEDPSSWRPYFSFVDILLEKYAKNEGFAVSRVNEKDGVSVRRRGRPRKRPKLRGKRLFGQNSSSEEEEAISSSDQEAPNEQDLQENDDEDSPLIHAIRSSSKLRTLKV